MMGAENSDSAPQQVGAAIRNIISISVSLALLATPAALAAGGGASPAEKASLLSSFGLQNPVPEILKLKPGQTVPAGVYEKYSSEQIALTIVYKKYLEDERERSEKAKSPAYDYLAGTEIQLAFPEKILSSVAERGFLNVYQTNSYQKNILESVRRGRASSEEGFLGYHLEKDSAFTASAEVRPKSAYLSLQAGKAERDPLVKSAGKGLSIGGYGNIFAVFNDDVKNRTTFTMGDSATSKPGKNEVRTLRFRSDTPLQIPSDEAYLEAQVWGPLAIKDVHHFLVNCEAGLDLSGKPLGRISEQGMRELKKLRRPIFECAEDRVGDRLIRIKRGKQIFFPSAPDKQDSSGDVGEENKKDGESQPAH